jgi:hypothetical protein
MKYFLGFLVLSIASLALRAEPVPHATRPDRLVETRGEFNVEYSPGQEAWMEMAFARMQAAPPAVAGLAKAGPGSATPATPASPRDLRARREALLAAAAAEIGLPAASPIQGKAFDTFLGYYEMGAELYQVAAKALAPRLRIRQVAIWQRDDLIARLQAGQKIEGATYDPATGKGNFEFAANMKLDDAANARLKEINEAIKAQQLNHSFKYDNTGYSATVKPYAPVPDAPKKPAADTPEAPAPEIVLPVMYRGPIDTPPSAEAFDATWVNVQEIGRNLEQRFRNYVDPTLVGVILHETVETGLVDRIITSKDRRWLCDGTANYAAWKISRQFFGPDVAQRVYDLDAKLREYATLQAKIDLARWSATENQQQGDHDSPLNRAHYVFATRAMFLLSGKHGDQALGLLWGDVAKTDRKKVTADTFAKAYRKRYKGNLAALIKAAEDNPIPAAP